MSSSFPGPTLLDYLRALYPPGTPGDLLAYVKEPFIRRFGVAANLDAYARQIEAIDAQHDAYVTINTLDGKSIRGRGTHTRGMESEVVAVVALVADVDAAGKDGHNYPPQARILQALEEMPLRTSIIVISGRPDGGLHVYWLLLTPFLIRSDEDRKRIKRVSEQWQRLLKAKLAPYELDSTFDLVRVLRPIGTTNKKYGSTVSAMVFQPDRRYRIEEFEAHLPRPEPVRTWTPPAGGDRKSLVQICTNRLPTAARPSTAQPVTWRTFPARSKGRTAAAWRITSPACWWKDSAYRLPMPCRSCRAGTRPANRPGAKASCSTSCNRQTPAQNAADTC